MDFLKRHGLQDSFKEYFRTHLEDGRPYTIILVKTLRHHVPLLEFRVNVREVGAFRAIFFEHQVANTQILAFAKAIIKQNTTDPEFERITLESEVIFAGVQANPEQYINLVGG
jgi:hypothetical protein